jgi:hypothetical protein
MRTWPAVNTWGSVAIVLGAVEALAAMSIWRGVRSGAGSGSSSGALVCWWR